MYMSPISILVDVFLEQIGKCLRWLSSLSLLHKRKKNSYIWDSWNIPKHMHSLCMMEKSHPNKMGRRDIPNPSTILQVPKTLNIPRRRRRRESSALSVVNRIMNNPHAWRNMSILWHIHFSRTTLETTFQRESRSRRKKILLLRKVIIMLLLQLIPHMIHGL